MENLEGLSNVYRNKNHEIYVSKADQTNEEQIMMTGDYNGRHFAIIRHSLGFPDCYIEVKEDDWIYQAEIGESDQRYDLYDGCVHGGATYYGRCYWDEKDTRFYLGWDYGHCGDYEAYNGEHGRLCSKEDKKWSYAELLMQIAQVWEGLAWMNDLHWEELHALPEERDGT